MLCQNEKCGLLMIPDSIDELCKRYCNGHLCPLCRKNGAIGKNNFCKGCRCQKVIQYSHENYMIRCVNPIQYGREYCIEHIM